MVCAIGDAGFGIRDQMVWIWFGNAKSLPLVV